MISDLQQVESNKTALAGVREEEKVGQRTLLDVLNAEQELLNSEVTLFTDKRNLVVASYNVLTAIGRLNSVELKLNSNVYDETAHYDEVKRKIFGTGINYSDGQTEGASLADGKKGGHGRINAANLRPTVTRPSDLNVAPLPKPATQIAPAAGAAPAGTSKPISITPPARGARRPVGAPATPASAPSVSPPLDSNTLPVPPPPPLPSLSPPLDAPTPITPPAGALPKSGQRTLPAGQAQAASQIQRATGEAQLRGSIDGGWTTKSERQ